MKFRKKPVVIDAELYALQGNEFELDQAQDRIADFMGVKTLATEVGAYPKIEIETLEGPIYASVGDYIIKGVQGEFYPCKPDVFAATYEPVEEVK